MDVLDARFVAAATAYDQLPAPMFAEVAFAGRSNVGKSSLINSLLARKKLVRTSSTPGCTRGIHVFRVLLRGGAELDLVDLPGYGYAKRSKAERRAWGDLIERFLEARPGLRAVVVIVDVRRGLEDDDAQLIEYLDHLGQRVLVVATKLDKLPASQRKPRLAALRADIGRPVFGYSAQTGDGRDKLSRALLRACAIALPEPD
ncbi:MAG: YihA family ribosome biogenesis GTP-binding protein [Myxococcales bacterium]|nr:YihA family ribosome biogenesis GTP-binding protein [Myxococcales bacterium]